MKPLRLTLSVAGPLVIILIAALLWPASRPQWLDLPDGRSVRIYAVTYGTNHLVGPPLACSATRLSPFAEYALVQVFGARMAVQQIKTATPQLLVWLEAKSSEGKIQNLPNINAFLGDGTNFISGKNQSVWSPSSPGPFSLMFDSFPRRDATITLNFFAPIFGGQTTNCGRLSFRNPARHSYPQWQPESLPSVKPAGDVEATLSFLETGHDSRTTVQPAKGGGTELIHGTNRSDGRNLTFVGLRLRSLSHPNERWAVKSLEISDPTGNQASSAYMVWDNIAQGFTFMPGLWPSERAWKIKLQIKQVDHFEPAQLFTFAHVPLGAPGETNTLGRTTNVAGNSLTLEQIIHRAPNTNQSFNLSSGSTFSFIMPSLTNGTQWDLLGVVFEPGKTNHPDGWTEGGSQRTYSFRQIPAAATTADFIFAVHQSRTVEFTVHPDLPPR